MRGQLSDRDLMRSRTSMLEQQSVAAELHDDTTGEHCYRVGRMSSLLEGWTSSPSAATAGPLVEGSLKAYPNPARRKPVQFAYQLTEDAEVEFRVLNAAGHEVTRWTRSGRRSDNLETWDPSGVPAGMYVARIQFKGPGGTQSASVPVGVIR